MAAVTIDLRNVPPAERHPKIMTEFAQLESGQTLRVINDHEPRPLYYQLREEVDSFDADRYTVEERAPNEFVADIPKI